MTNIAVKVRSTSGLLLPEYASSGASGMDLRSTHDLTLAPGQIAAVGTGLYAEIPEGYEFQVRPRSGLALKHGITLPNSPGTIDADYRGEIKVIIQNLGPEPFVINRGDRIAQMVLCTVTKFTWHEHTELSDTERAAGGFGSTGK